MRKIIALLLLLCTLGAVTACGEKSPGGKPETKKPLDLSTLLPDVKEALGEKTVKVREESEAIYSISIHNCSKDEAKRYFDLLKDGKWSKNAVFSDKLIVSSFTADTEDGKYTVYAEHSPLQLILKVTVSKIEASSQQEGEKTA